ncbi:hypothetical protein BSKO_11311 [Bryopsis sp. KO-2023]|nr:hypothetical protein BSKO_11311 [Bryopsis sp. KO-2023]
MIVRRVLGVCAKTRRFAAESGVWLPAIFSTASGIECFNSAAQFSPTDHRQYPKTSHNDVYCFPSLVRHLAKKPSGGAAGGGLAFDDFSTKEMENLMEKALDHFRGELSNVRAGRASPGMLDHISVIAYGEKTPMKAVGTVIVKDPQLLGVSVFDPDTVDAVVKAIRESPLNLNPSAEGTEILVPIPKPTKEGLQGLAKVVAKEAEKCKVSVRNGRKVGLEQAKQLVSEDDKKRAEKDVQKLTDKFVGEVDRIKQVKEKELLHW